MLKIKRFAIGKKKQYRGIVIKFWIFKFERIVFKNKFLWRFEINNWDK